ncbi:MAG: septum site-determining protein MinC [Mariprofundaceae bacterium]|nr:septum site-determining protein MinC [Mariprofundaceae bacterium]
MTEQKTHEVPFEFKGSVFSMPVLQLHNNDLRVVKAELSRRLSESQRFFLNAPLVVDLSTLSALEGEVEAVFTTVDFPELLTVLRQAALLPVGIVHGSKKMQADAISAGLAVLPTSAQHSNNVKKEAPKQQATVSARVPTKIVTHTVRTGQQVYAQGGDLVVMASVNAGAEIAADGDIHVYGSLRGRALAGARGDTKACIFAHAFAGEMLVIAGFYRAFEISSVEAQGGATQAWLEGERLLIAPIDCFT